MQEIFWSRFIFVYYVWRLLKFYVTSPVEMSEIVKTYNPWKSHPVSCVADFIPYIVS
jgi:hypothetical protein